MQMLLFTTHQYGHQVAVNPQHVVTIQKGLAGARPRAGEEDTRTPVTEVHLSTLMHPSLGGTPYPRVLRVSESVEAAIELWELATS